MTEISQAEWHRIAADIPPETDHITKVTMNRTNFEHAGYALLMQAVVAYSWLVWRNEEIENEMMRGKS